MRRLSALLPLALAFAADAATAADGAAVYRDACARCHRNPDRLAATLPADRAEAEAALRALLERHHPVSGEAGEALVAYLAGLGR